MKKTFGILGLILAIGIGSAFVYADSPIGPKDDSEYIYDNYEDREEWHKERIKEEVEKGNISEEEAKEWEEHHEYMKEFHEENGFGGCHRGMRGRHHRRWNW
ncbi:MAG TPA: hypothetical protein VK087_02735 [Tissierellaceae bacterium]|nr:hypothetical protein [Tissierellaceae bacterium]